MLTVYVEGILMNLLSLLKNENTNDEIQQIKKDNNKQLQEFNKWCHKNIGHRINKETINTLSTKRLFECYDYNEIIRILKYYNQI